MRSINANLTTEQAKLSARPYLSFTVGDSAYDISAYVVRYRYDEHAEVPGRHEIALDNKDGTFNTLTGDLAAIAAGNYLTMARGVQIATDTYTAELPRVWIEELEYTYRKSQAQLILHCIDPWERLRRTRVATTQTWTAQPASEILEWIVETAGLSLDERILNGDFETYTAPNWLYWTKRTTNGTIADEGSIVHGGSHAVKITSGSSLDTWIYTDAVVEEYRRYTLRVWARGDGTYSGRYAIYDTLNGAWVSTLTSLGVTNATYEQVDINWQAPAGCTGVRIYLAGPAHEFGYAYFDDVEVLPALDDLNMDFEIVPTEHLYNAARRMLRACTQYAYWGLDGTLKLKELDPTEASAYTLGWNANHQLLEVQRSIQKAWEVNSVTVNGADTATGSATNSTQISAVGTRHLTVHDVRLTTNDECSAAATAMLRYFQARAQEAILIAHPVHGLEMYDMITLDSPPWGGSNVSGRVIGILETYDHDKGTWQQVITLGYPTHYINRSTADGSLIVNIPAAGVILDELNALTAWTGDLIVDGELEIATDGYLRSGQTGYNTGTGFWMEYNAGTPRLSLGAAAGNRVTWDGSTLTIVGTVTAEAGSLGTLSVTGTLTLSGSGKLITAASPAARVELTTTELAGYSDATTKQFYLDASTGKAYAGAGAVRLDTDGLTIVISDAYARARSVTFADDDNTELVQLQALVGSSQTWAKLKAINAGGTNEHSGVILQSNAKGTGYSMLEFWAQHESNDPATLLLYNLGSNPYDRYAMLNKAWLSVEYGLWVGNDTAGSNYPPAGVIAMTDGVTAPSTISGAAQLYVDTADGDLKVKFGDGTVKTIAT
ncbi:MAG: hypothetical protein ACK2VA_00710, partial [Anaerolineae bacterium]